MRTPVRTLLLLAGSGWLLLGTTGCLRDQPAPRAANGATFGVTQEPFRGRWWQYYERGVSWAMGGFLDLAEADFRTCIALRQDDSRLARTYGMHFVQCFVHRELGAVLISGGRLDEAESELLISIAAEPSAKAEALLQRIRDQRAGAAAAAPGAAPAALAAAAA
ncbi:MAG: hypothetical protein H0X38_15780, partial [Planctomycetes bacterium]|nr:hypothetical protein [Planctomycetota bacterium]